jgi:aldose 1-epimerase
VPTTSDSYPNPIADYQSLPCGAAAHSIVAGDLEAVFLPGCGMLGVSLRHQGIELLRRLEGLAAAAAKGSTAGIPLLHPWANRLASTRYSAAGREITLDPASPLLHVDENGLPIHGVPWAKLAWETIEAVPDRLAARLDWTGSDLLAIFPFPHRLTIEATIRADGLTLETALIADSAGPVPVSFGFHPYFGLPDLPRSQWRLELPAMRRCVLDRHGIPTGEEEAFAGFAGPLSDCIFDDGFAVLDERPSFSLWGASRRITVEFLAGFPYAQIFAPTGKDFVAIEPMTAPTNALGSGRGLRIVEAGAEFRTAFRIGVEKIS